jgi:putative membrane protein (TIGR04086 family)
MLKQNVCGDFFMDTAHRTARLAGKRKGGLLRSVTFGFFITLFSGALLLFLCALLLMQTNDPGKNASLFGLLCLSLAALIGGFAAGRRNKCQGALAGLLSGLFTLALLFLLSLFMKGEEATVLYAVVTRATLLLFAVFGGILGASRPSRRKRR